MEIEVVENVMQYNKAEAQVNRTLFAQNKITAVNILSAPGAGKTTLIIETFKRFLKSIKIGVIEGDISSTHDAEKIKEFTDNIVQINTGGTCHLNASMIAEALKKMDTASLDLVFIENVGNLICPVGFDLGEDYQIVISSVSEGDDKPVKYPKAFIKCNLVVLNKMDMISFSDFDDAFFEKTVKDLNPQSRIMKLSCKTGEGFEAWALWLEEIIKDKKRI